MVAKNKIIRKRGSAPGPAPASALDASVCQVEDAARPAGICGQAVIAKGLCMTHYQRQRRKSPKVNYPTRPHSLPDQVFFAPFELAWYVLEEVKEAAQADGATTYFKVRQLVEAFHTEFKGREDSALAAARALKDVDVSRPGAGDKMVLLASGTRVSASLKKWLDQVAYRLQTVPVDVVRRIVDRWFLSLPPR